MKPKAAAQPRSTRTTDKRQTRSCGLPRPGQKCPQCQQGIKFRDVDVSRDPAAARDMVRRSCQRGVPVVDIGGKIVVGFDRNKINQLLGLK